MLRLFQSGKLSRWTYVMALISFLAFDLAKDPATRFLESGKEAIQHDIYMSDGEHIREKYEDATRLVPPTADDGVRQRLATVQTHDFAGAVAGVALMEAKNSIIGSIFISLLVVIGVASYLILIWIIFARLRDDEWPNWVASQFWQYRFGSASSLHPCPIWFGKSSVELSWWRYLRSRSCLRNRTNRKCSKQHLSPPTARLDDQVSGRKHVSQLWNTSKSVVLAPPSVASV